MSTTAQQIADDAWKILGDYLGTPGVRWPAADVLIYINAGQREVVVHLPSAYTKAVIATVVAGTRQTMSGLSITDGIRFLGVTRNFASNGTTVGRAITPRPMAWINAERPFWHMDTAAELVHSFHDPMDPKAIYVWPPATGSAKAEFIYSAIPADVATIGGNITLDDIYVNALTYYVLFRAMTKQQNFAQNALASTFYQLFLQCLGTKGQADKGTDPNLGMLADGAGVAGPGAHA